MSYGFLHNTMLGMTYEEIEKSVEQNELVLVPVGVVEAHGPHLPLGTDIYVSMSQAEAIQKNLKEMSVGSVIAPPFYLGGIQAMTRQFAGTFTSKKETIIGSFIDYLASLDRFGYERCVLLNNHGDHLHIEALIEAIKKSNAECYMKAYWMEFEDDLEYDGFSKDDDYLALIAPFSLDEFAIVNGELTDPCDWHAGAYETAMMEELYPEEVRQERIQELHATNLQGNEITQWTQGEAAYRQIIPQAYCGDPAKSIYITTNSSALYIHQAKSLKEFLGL